VLPTVALSRLDTKVTTIDLTSSAPIQVARGSLETDSSGSRQATLLFPAGVQASMKLPDGSTRPLTSLDVRATEYTVGAMGPSAMPGDLPPTSGYTYAVELSVDQAIAAGATEVDFSRPIPFYLQNFLDFPVGMAVPAGSYDRASGQWIASQNGRVIEVLSEHEGEADLDIDGDGQADTTSALAALGITDSERIQVASLYAPGQTLWRVPVPHFTPWDYNWPYGPPAGAKAPAINPTKINSGNPVSDPNVACGSIVGVENQTLGESVPIAGTPFSLVYASDRTPGRIADRSITIPLIEGTPPAPLKRIDLQVFVEGREFDQSFEPAADLSTVFTWDGHDAYGRDAQGTRPIKVRIGYVYDAVYYEPAEFAQSFATISGVPILGNKFRHEITVYQNIDTTIGAFDASALGLGGWTLDAVDIYDPLGRVIYQGDGQTRRAEALGRTISTAVDFDQIEPDRLWYLNSIAVGPDGSLYIASDARVYRVMPDGTRVVVAGSVGAGFSGDGGPATEATFSNRLTVTLGPDGSLYINDSDNHRIRRVTPDGIVRTIAGDGQAGYGGDGGPALSAQIDTWQLAVGPDGSVYFAQNYDARIRRIGPDGIITTFAGTGEYGFGGDGGPAALAKLGGSESVAVGPDGSVYIGDSGNHRIRRVGPDGIITTVAGAAWDTYDLDTREGIPATDALFSAIDSLTIGPDGTIYVSEGLRIRAITPDGLIRTIAGYGESDFSGANNGDGGPALQARWGNSIFDMAVGPDGSLYIDDGTVGRVRRISPPMPSFTSFGFSIPSEDGSVIEEFDANGRQLRTRDALTNTLIYEFGYDSAGRLASITDGDGNVIRIEHDAAGNPTAIVGPYGQRTVLTVDAAGHLTRITDPAGGSTTLETSPDGLLTSFTDGDGNTSTFTYDDTGRLIEDHNAVDGFTKLARQELGGGNYKVTTTDAEGGTRQYLVERLPDGSLRRTTVDGRGFATVLVTDPDGTVVETDPDGTVTTTVLGPDPRYGMLAPIVQSLTVRIPSGSTSTTTITVDAEFQTPGDRTSPLVRQIQTTDVDGRVSTTVYDAAARTITQTSPAGRVSMSTLDEKGRLVESESPGQLPETYSYDARGRLASTTQGDRTITFGYDAAGYLSTVTDPLGHTVTLEHDAAGRVTRQIQPDGSAIDFRFDAAGNLVGITPPGQPEHTFSYDAAGRATDETAPDVGDGAAATSYTYDAAGRVIREDRPGGVSLSYTYCECGRLESITAPTGLYDYVYDSSTGQLTGLTSPGGFSLSFGYDGALATSQTLTGPVSGRVDWTYDAGFRLASESINGGSAVTFAYDDDGLLIRAGDLNLTRDPASGRATGSTLGQVSDSLSYNDYGELSGYSASAAGSAALTDDYTRDDLGRITRRVEMIGGITKTTDYGYDLLGRLTTVTEDGVLVQRYTYDANGNRLSLTTPVGTVTSTYDARDRLLTSGTKSYIYTADGHLASVTDSATGETTRYTYDAFGNLTRVEQPDGRVVEYLVDGENRRVGTEVDGVLTQGLLYRGALQPVATLDAAGNVDARFVYAGGGNVPAYMIQDGTTYRLITDQLGSVRLVVDTATGAVAQRIDYDAFGRVTLDTNPGFQPFGFAGGLYDPNTGLTRFGARDYDAAAGRWTAPDPIGFAAGDSDLYGYAGFDPVNHEDYDGLLWGFINAGEGYADEAEMYWAKKYVTSSNPVESAVYGVLGATSALWDHCTSDTTFSILSTAYGGGKFFSKDFYRYVGPQSNPAGRWLVLGKPPYGNNYFLAKDALQLPHMPNQLVKAKVPWWQPVTGPRPALLNPQWGTGGGSEWYAGWRFPPPQ
jgi:RHS repeat-associated protein